MSGPAVGVGVFVVDPLARTVLLGERKGSLGAGTWALPGGHLEREESFAACAARETAEETGLALEPARVRFLTAGESVFAGGQHYVTVFVGYALREGEPRDARVVEREKCGGWEWVRWEDVVRWVRAGEGEGAAGARAVFLPLRSLVEQKPGLDPVALVLAPRETYGV